MNIHAKRELYKGLFCLTIPYTIVGTLPRYLGICETRPNLFWVIFTVDTIMLLLFLGTLTFYIIDKIRSRKKQ